MHSSLVSRMSPVVTGSPLSGAEFESNRGYAAITIVGLGDTID